MPTKWMRDPAARLRPVPEQACCLVYRPRPPALHGLNLTSWLVFSLCDGRDEDSIRSAYRDAVASAGGPGAASGAFDSALSQLARLGLIQKMTEEQRP